jgi:hypothetical protein
MSLKYDLDHPDGQRHGMIEPYESSQVRSGVISTA